MIVDIHCHIVPGVDDGAASLDVALAMIEEAKAQGVVAIATTPHIRGRAEEAIIHEKHKEAFAAVTAEERGLELQLSGEVRVTSDSHNVVSRREFTYGEMGKYILLELPHDQVPPYFTKLIFDYRLAGITPIVAHPERNAGVLKDPELALDFVRQGALLQLTNSSLLGEIGEAFQQCAMAMLESGLVGILASDAHNVTSRTFGNWSATVDLLTELQTTGDGGKVFDAIQLYHDNPRAVFDGKPINMPEIEESKFPEIRKRLSSYARRSDMKRKRFFFF